MRRANIKLFLFLINIVAQFMRYLIHNNILFLVVKLNPDLCMNSTFDTSNLDIERFAMEEIQIIRPDNDIFLLFRVGMGNSDFNFVLLVKVFVDEGELFSLWQSHIVKLYEYLRFWHEIFNLVGNGLLGELGNFVENVFWDLLNQDFIVFFSLGHLVHHFEIQSP